MPVYCEGTHLISVIEEVRDQFSGLGVDHEFVLVDDGSPDDTWLVIAHEAQNSSDIRAFRLSRNFGKESAISAGIELCHGDAIVVLDADGQHPPVLLPEMIRRWHEGYEIVEGVKSARGRETIINKLGAKIFYATWNRLSGFELNGASDYKLLDRRAVNAYLAMPERNVFFRGMTAWLGFRTAQISFEVAERSGGRSGWSLWKRARLAIDGISGFSALPLQLVTLTGVLFLIFSLIFAISTLAQYMSGHAVTGFATVILLLLIIGSLLMISLGIIGIYIARVYEEIKDRPRFVVAEKIEDSSAGETTDGPVP